MTPEELCDAMKADEKRSVQRRVIRGSYDGKAPYEKSDTEPMHWPCNVITERQAKMLEFIDRLKK